MKLVPLTLLVFVAPALAGECLTYSGEVTLRGALSEHTFPEQPNYESIAKGDAPATYFFISPPKPFCVAAGDPNNNEPSESQIARVQLVFPSKVDGYGPLRPYLSKEVECTGSLYHAISGHHHSPVLLLNAKCHAA